MSESDRLRRREIPELPKSSGLRSVPAWAISLLLHVTIVVLAGTLWSNRPKGTGGEVERPVGVAVVYEAAGVESYALADGDGTSEAVNQAEAEASLQQSLQSGAETFSALENELLADLLPGSTSAAGDVEAAAGSVGLGDGGSTVGGNRSVPKLKTSVFGIEGEGTRFLYVFDRSNSMNGYGGAPLQAAKGQLRESIRSLGEVHQFQIIFYNESPLPFGGLSSGGPKLLRGNEQTKYDAERFVRDIRADGGTGHIDALRMGLSMGPDVLFFLTDAAEPAMSSRDVENLQDRAFRIGATIHSIEFGSGPKQTRGGWIEKLATGTQGQYRYIDVTKL